MYWRETGVNSTDTLQVALAASQQMCAQRPLTQSQWQNRWQVLAGVLPAWAEGDERDSKGPVKECAAALNDGVDLAIHMTTKWHQCAKAGSTFAKARLANRGLLQLTLRAWREQAEREVQLRDDAAQQRSAAAHDAAHATQASAAPQLDTASQEKTFSQHRREDWRDVTPAARTWNPWGTRLSPAQETQTTVDLTTGPPTLSEHQMHMRWKLRDKCLRVATYYRVLELHRRALRKKTLSRLRARFASWALSFVDHTKLTARQEIHDALALATRHSRRDRVSANTRMGMTDVDLYREARRNTTRPRAANGSTRRILLPTHLDTEIGHRLYENMNLIATRFRMWREHDPG
jgi:hypothetical protein